MDPRWQQIEQWRLWTWLSVFVVSAFAAAGCTAIARFAGAGVDVQGAVWAVSFLGSLLCRAVGHSDAVAEPQQVERSLWRGPVLAAGVALTAVVLLGLFVLLILS